MSTLLTSIRRIVEFMEQFQQGMTGFERFCEIMDDEPDVVDAPGAAVLTDVKGDVTFDHVSFRYSDNDKSVLADINVHVPAGQRVALVGPSGSGKTTLCNLIPRFYNLTGGRILIDGKDITALTQHTSLLFTVQSTTSLKRRSLFFTSSPNSPRSLACEDVRFAHL